MLSPSSDLKVQNQGTVLDARRPFEAGPFCTFAQGAIGAQARHVGSGGFQLPPCHRDQTSLDSLIPGH